MAESRPGRSRAVVALIVAATMLATALVGIVPAGSQTAGTAVAVDIIYFFKSVLIEERKKFSLSMFNLK